MKAAYVKIMCNLREDNDKIQQDIATVLVTSQIMYTYYERTAKKKYGKKPCFIAKLFLHT